MNPPEASASSLPHHRLVAYQVALELVQLVGSVRIRDAHLRMQLTLFRSVTQRSDERRDVPWKTLLGEIFLAFMTLTNEKLGPRSLLSLMPD